MVMIKFRRIVLIELVLFLTVLVFSACSENNSSENIEIQTNSDNDTAVNSSELFTEIEYIDSSWRVDGYYSSIEIDTLLIDLVSYIYRKPSVATWQTKLNPEYRQYYINHTDRFEIVYYSIKENVHYYYLLRPARNEDGYQQRGVGGLFRRDATHKIVDFEEVFNTAIMSSDSLKQIGYHLFLELIQSSNVNTFVDDRSIIEWPDGSLFYSKEKKEWRYVD
jgi:hypothetical protein